MHVVYTCLHLEISTNQYLIQFTVWNRYVPYIYALPIINQIGFIVLTKTGGKNVIDINIYKFKIQYQELNQEKLLLKIKEI